MPKPRDLNHIVGQKFGEWKVVRLSDGIGIKNRKADCVCSCGTKSSVLVTNLLRGLSASCARHHRPSRRRLAVPVATLPEYHIWCGIQKRCTNKRDAGYPRYGGRGITVCERWRGKDGFPNFLTDMGARPSESHSIERKNNHGPYSPDNCVWATPTEQANNTRSNRIVTYRGESKTLAQWGRFLGIHHQTLRNRIGFLGWSVEDAFTRPVGNNRGRLPTSND